LNPIGNQRREIHYSGHVQGVGFRYTARGIARHYDVTGFVRNLPDGRVWLVIEGPPGQLDEMVEEIATAMGHHIQQVSMLRSSATGEFRTFEIAY
jgi:acylphosphatase